MSRGRMRPAPRVEDIDLARPVRVRPEVKHVVPPPVDSDATVRAIADILASSARFERLPGDFGQEVAGLEHLLAPYGIKRTAIRMALGLAYKEGGGQRGTAHTPNAILRHHHVTLTGQIRKVRDSEVFYRAAYLANAAHRLQRAMNGGANQRAALRQERVYYRMHEEARRGRLKAVAQVERAGQMFGEWNGTGTLLGWYLNPLLHNEVECITANGNNFYMEAGTVIGLPGSVHNRCGCYAGPPHQGAPLVDDVLKNVVAFKRSRPRFKLKERHTA